MRQKELTNNKMKIPTLVFILGFAVNSAISQNGINDNQPLIPSGKYGFIDLAFNGTIVSGAYQFYDKWDTKANEFRDINKFYFYGEKRNGNQYRIIGGHPNDVFFCGLIILDSIKRTITLVLSDQPNGYANDDFTEGYSVKSDSKKEWIQIRIVKSLKANFYTEASINQKKKAYLVRGDYVNVLKYSDGFVLVEYYRPNTNKPLITGWLNENDLYSLNPLDWD